MTLVPADPPAKPDQASDQARPGQVEPGQANAEPSPVDLVKHKPGQPDQPGKELATRPRYVVARLARPARRAVDMAGNVRAEAMLKAVAVVDHPRIRRAGVRVVKSPIAAAKIVAYSPRGLGLTIRKGFDWTRDVGSEEMGRKAVDRDDIEGWHKVVSGREKRNLPARKWIAGIVLVILAIPLLAWFARPAFVGLLGVVTFGMVAWWMPRKHLEEALWSLGLAALAGWLVYGAGAPWLADHIPFPNRATWLVAGLVAIVTFGWLGRPDGSLVDLPARMASTKPAELTAHRAIAALMSLGNSKMKDPDLFRVLMDPHRVGDQGVQIDLELPEGVTATWVMEQREALAASLRRNLSTVWPQMGSAHPGHLALFVSYIPMNETMQERWPLLNRRTIDIFEPQPVFTDQLGKWVYLTLAYASWVIGAVPRMGKTFTLRELLLIAGMDPRVRVIAWDGKGTGDLSPLAAFLHGHIRGARVDDMTNIYLALNTVRELIIEMGKRADFLASLPFDEAPESKVTSELADKYPDILGPIFFGIDETQSFFSFGARSEKEHKEIRVEIRDSVIELMRLGPALGIWVAMATQTVRDSTIPTEAAAVAVYRYGLKMESHEPNDRVLGTGAHKQGVSATMFGFEEKGIGWFKGEGAKPFIARSVVGLDAVAARVIASRIRQARLAMNLLTGDAAGDLNTVEAEVVYDIVADAAFVMRQRERGRAQWVELVPWLKDLRPAHYADLTEEELSARIRSITGRSRDVRSGDFVKKGTFLSDLRKQENEDEA